MLVETLTGLGVLVAIALAVIGWNRLMDRLNPKLPTRPWVAVSPSAKVPLGVVDYPEALARANKLGKVTFVDDHYGLIFLDTNLGGDLPPGLAEKFGRD